MPDSNSNIVSIKIQNYDKTVVYSNLVLSQTVCGHHEFRFIWNAGDFKSDVNFQLKIIKDFIGASVNIAFSDNEFNGIITEIAIDDRSSDAQSFTIKGQSPTVLIDDIPRSSSYYKKPLTDIIKKVLENVPDNSIGKTIEPVTKDKLHYTTQYNETDFQFLSRLAIRYGEWFYYDGSKLIFGKPGTSNAKLKVGTDLDRVVIQANLQPSKYNYKSYDAHKGETISKNLATLDKDIKNDFATTAISHSLDTYSLSADRPMHSFNVVNKDQIDALSKIEAAAINSRMLTVTGESKNPFLKSGCTFEIESQGGTYEYIAIKVIHYSNLLGNYHNTFTGVPATVKVPPYTNPHSFRKGDTQTAMVKENHDSDGIGRVKVQFHWQSGSDLSPWLRVSTPHAGNGKGMHFIPEKGEEVIVDFEGGDVDKPFILGSMYNGKAKSGHGDGDNNTKGLQSRSGNKVLLDDKAGSVLITDKTSNNKIFIDGSGNLTVDSTDSIKFTCGDSSIEMKKDGTINITGKKITVDGTEITVGGSDKAIIGSGPASFSAEKSGDATVSGTKTIVSGTAEVTVTGAKATLNGDATTDVTSTGPTAIAGAIVKLN